MAARVNQETFQKEVLEADRSRNLLRQICTAFSGNLMIWNVIICIQRVFLSKVWGMLL